MGGVLPYKWEAYCSTNERCTVGFSSLQGLEARKVQRYKRGAYCRTKWRCIAALSPGPVGARVHPKNALHIWVLFRPPSFRKEKAHKLKQSPRHNGRVSPGQLPGQTRVHRPVFQGFPVVFFRKTGTLPGHWPDVLGTLGRPGVFQKFSVIFRGPVDPVVWDPVWQDSDKIWRLGSFVPSLCVL